MFVIIIFLNFVICTIIIIINIFISFLILSYFLIIVFIIINIIFIIVMPFIKTLNISAYHIVICFSFQQFAVQNPSTNTLNLLISLNPFAQCINLQTCQLVEAYFWYLWRAWT